MLGTPRPAQAGPLYRAKVGNPGTTAFTNPLTIVGAKTINIIAQVPIYNAVGSIQVTVVDP